VKVEFDRVGRLSTGSRPSSGGLGPRGPSPAGGRRVESMTADVLDAVGRPLGVPMADDEQLAARRVRLVIATAAAS